MDIWIRRNTHEERTEEESVFLLVTRQRGFLVSPRRETSVRAFGMTELGAFLATHLRRKGTETISPLYCRAFFGGNT
jgi:hypothetical protein